MAVNCLLEKRERLLARQRGQGWGGSYRGRAGKEYFLEEVAQMAPPASLGH